jgi:hypothetical protein
MWPFICLFLYHICDFNLVSPTYSVPSCGRLPASGGLNVTDAAQVAEPHTVKAQPSDKAIGGGGVPVTDAAVAAGAAV